MADPGGRGRPALVIFHWTAGYPAGPGRRADDLAERRAGGVRPFRRTRPAFRLRRTYPAGRNTRIDDGA
jgi:hypothetical protein